jgi:hypothetical protein
VTGSNTFCELVERCGLSQMFAKHAMARAIVRAGVFPETMSMSDLPAVFPEVERVIRPFLPSAEVIRVMEELRAWWWKAATQPTRLSA